MTHRRETEQRRDEKQAQLDRDTQGEQRRLQDSGTRTLLPGAQPEEGRKEGRRDAAEASQHDDDQMEHADPPARRSGNEHQGRAYWHEGLRVDRREPDLLAWNGKQQDRQSSDPVSQILQRFDRTPEDQGGREHLDQERDADRYPRRVLHRDEVCCPTRRHTGKEHVVAGVRREQRLPESAFESARKVDRSFLCPEAPVGGDLRGAHEHQGGVNHEGAAS